MVPHAEHVHTLIHTHVQHAQDVPIASTYATAKTLKHNENGNNNYYDTTSNNDNKPL